MSAFLSGIPVFWLNFALHTALISAAGWLACRLIRKPGHRSFVALLAVAAIVVLPWATAARPLPSFRKTQVKTPAISQTSFPEWTIRIQQTEAPSLIAEPEPAAIVQPSPRVDWLQTFAIVWIAGSFIGFAGIAFRQWKLWRWARGHRLLRDEEWSAIHGIDLRRDRFRVCDQAASPCIVGFFRPQVVLPTFLFRESSAVQLGWAVRHEAEHLRAGDGRSALLLAFSKAILWWNPFVHSLATMWADARERVCDAQAIREESQRRSYGNFLLDLSEHCHSASVGAVLMARSGQARRMKKRILAVLAGGPRIWKISAAFKSSAFIAVGLVAVFATCAGVAKEPDRFQTADAIDELIKKESDQRLIIPDRGPETDIATEKTALAAEPPANAEAGKEKLVRPPQFKLTTKFLSTSEKFTGDWGFPTGRSFTDVEVQWMLQRLSEHKGIELMTTPSVTMLNGQKAAIEIIKTDPKEVQNEVPADTRKSRFFGVSLEAQVESSSDEIRVTIDCLIKDPPGESAFNLEAGAVPENFDWNTVRTLSAKATKTLKSGEVLVLDFEGMEPGKRLTGFFTVTSMDAAGREIDAFGNLVSPPVPFALPSEPTVPRDGAVKIHGAIVVLPKDGKLGQYKFNRKDTDGLISPVYPIKQLAAIRHETLELGKKASWKDLGTATLRSGEPAKPWADFPVEMKIQLTTTNECQLRIKLPGERGEGVETPGLLGYVFGRELKPGADGKRRMLLLSLEKPEP